MWYSFCWFAASLGDRLQLTEHTDLGLRVLMLLAATGNQLPASEIAERHRSSYSHIQKVIQSLQSAGFVETFRGRNGGVRLARPADDIRVGDVVRALEPHFQMADCFRETPSCRFYPGCALKHVLASGRDAMLAEFDRHTLASIVARSSMERILPAS